MHTLNKASQYTSVSRILEASVTATEEQSRGEAQTEQDIVPNACHASLSQFGDGPTFFSDS